MLALSISETDKVGTNKQKKSHRLNFAVYRPFGPNEVGMTNQRCCWELLSNLFPCGSTGMGILRIIVVSRGQTRWPSDAYLSFCATCHKISELVLVTDNPSTDWTTKKSNKSNCWRVRLVVTQQNLHKLQQPVGGLASQKNHAANTQHALHSALALSIHG